MITDVKVLNKSLCNQLKPLGQMDFTGTHKQENDAPTFR